MKLVWKGRRAQGDLGHYEITKFKGKFVSQWIPKSEKGYRAYSNPAATIEEAQRTSQIMEDDMTGVSLMTDERWEAFLNNSDIHTKEVYSCPS